MVNIRYLTILVVHLRLVAPFSELPHGSLQRRFVARSTGAAGYYPTLCFLGQHKKRRSDNLQRSFLKHCDGSTTRLGIRVEGSTATSVDSQEDKAAAGLVLNQFHADMRDVLEKRRFLLEPFLERSKNRQERPVVLDQKSDDLDGAQRVHSMLQRLIGMNLATTESFEIVLEAFVHRDRMRWQNTSSIVNATHSSSSRKKGSDPSLVCAADQAEQLWHQLVAVLGEFPQKNQTSIVPVSTYNLVLQAYANCASPRASKPYARRALELYQQLEASHGESPSSLVQVVRAFAREQANLRPGRAAQEAQRHLDRIRSQLDAPTLLQCYDWVLEAWSKSGDPGSAERSQQLFDAMKSLNETTEASSIGALDAQSYSNTILAWSKDSSFESTQQSHNLLQEMIAMYRSGALANTVPPLIAFNGVIAAWGRALRPDQAELVLQWMQSLRPQCPTLEPDVYSYNSVLNAYLRSKLPPDQILEKVNELVKEMSDAGQKNPSVRPNSFTYYTQAKAWIQSGQDDACLHADALLQKIEHCWKKGDRSLKVSNIVSNMVINLHAKSGNELAARSGLDILNRMKASKLCHPDNISYTSVLECLSKSRDMQAPQQAMALFEELNHAYERTKDVTLMPNLRTYTMTILTFANNHGNVTQARDLLSRLVELYEVTRDPQLRPNEYAYNYVLNCAANSLSYTQEAFIVATETYQEMRKSSLVQPDSYTYAFWLKCCSKLLPPGELRHKCVTYAFEECCKGGLLTNEVLTRLFQGVPPSVVDQLLDLPRKGPSYRTLRASDLPPSWSRNAAQRR